MRELSPLFVEWLSDWQRHNSLAEPLKHVYYVRAELERLQAAGIPLLYAALRAPFMEQTDLAVKAIREMCPGGIYLRLVDGAVPPKRDPQGRLLPPEKNGKVLVAFVGERGQAIAGTTIADMDRSGESSMYQGSMRRSLEHSPNGLYRNRNVTRDAALYTVDDAIVIMRAWGVGIREERFRNPGDPERRMDTWLVEEVPQMDGAPISGWTSPYDAPAPAPTSKRS